MKLLLEKIKFGIKFPGIISTVFNDKVVIWLVSWSGLFCLSSYYNSLFYQTLIFHIIKYSIVGLLVCMILWYKHISKKFQLNRRNNLFKFVLIGLTIWDTF